MTPHVALRLGRVSNLPTVWSNTLAAIVLAGTPVRPREAVLLGLGMSLFYVGGMFLNDAFDADVDAKERPERPIPSGLVSRGSVFRVGFALLGLGFAAVAAHGFLFAESVRITPLVAACLLGACIVAYDARHKGNPFGPVLMAGCRLGVYGTIAFAVSATPGTTIGWAGAGLVSYLAGLTAVAKFGAIRRANAWAVGCLFAPPLALCFYAAEPLPFAILVLLLGSTTYSLRLLVPKSGPPHVGPAVAGLIAGISLWDAAWAATLASPYVAASCVASFALTLVMQRYVPGT